jgi:hypothetical protein
MPLHCYRDKKFNAARRAIIDQANKILAEYSAAGYDITLRQLYYQFVARGLIENTQKSYKRLGACIDEARLAGLIDWDYIVDRTRNLQGRSSWRSPSDIIDSCYRSFHFDRWANQKYRVEVWCEKEALIGIFARVARTYDVDYFACRGYVSQSEMWRAARRLARYRRNGQQTVILHFGDHDPSGIDMTRDIVDRMEMYGTLLDVKRLALNMPQVEKYSPPPNPAKMTDSRFDGYVAAYGDESWELDALDPDVLAGLVAKSINKYRDLKAWKQTIEREQDARTQLKVLSDNWDEITDEMGNTYEGDFDDARDDLAGETEYSEELK